MHFVHNLRIESVRGCRRIVRDATDNFRNVVSLKFRIARIDAFRREGQQKIFIQFQTGFRQHRQEHFIGSAGIGG